MPANIPPCSATPIRTSTIRASRTDRVVLHWRRSACGQRRGGTVRRRVWLQFNARRPHLGRRAAPRIAQFHQSAAGQVQSREGGTLSRRRKSNNYSIGFELAPQIDFLRGLDLQATWYSVKVNGTLLGFNDTTTQTLADPNQTVPHHPAERSRLSGGGECAPASLRAVRKNGGGRSDRSQQSVDIQSANRTSIGSVTAARSEPASSMSRASTGTPAMIGSGRSRRLEYRHHRHLLPAPLCADGERRRRSSICSIRTFRPPEAFRRTASKRCPE